MRRHKLTFTPQNIMRRLFLFLTPPSVEGGGHLVVYIYSLAL
jgi:hypothetical protein